jgi:hypothetical protein
VRGQEGGGRGGEEEENCISKCYKSTLRMNCMFIITARG